MRDDVSRLVGLEGFVVTAVEVIDARRFLHAAIALVKSSAGPRKPQGGTMPSAQDEQTYHLELTAPQVKITWSALRSMLNDFGHNEPDVHRAVREVLAKLPPEDEIRAIDLSGVLGRGRRG